MRSSCPFLWAVLPIYFQVVYRQHVFCICDGEKRHDSLGEPYASLFNFKYALSYLLKLKFRKLLEYTDKEKTLHSKLSERLRKEK